MLSGLYKKPYIYTMISIGKQLPLPACDVFAIFTYELHKGSGLYIDFHKTIIAVIHHGLNQTLKRRSLIEIFNAVRTFTTTSEKLHFSNTHPPIPT